MTVIGVDSNPIAVQISKAKLGRVNVEYSVKKIKKIISQLNLNKKKIMPQNAACYFHPDTANQIMQLKQYYEEFSEYEKAVFLGTICLAARGCNNYKWSSTQIGTIAKKKLYIDFFDKFLMKIKKHAYPVDPNDSKIIEGDSRKLSKIVPAKTIDFVYTSPPYFDALDYTSNYTRIIHYIFDNDLSYLKQKLIQNFDNYASDMKKCFEEIKKVTKNDALIVFVVGNKKKGPELINGGDFFKEIITEAPTYIEEREYADTASKIWDKINKTKRKEQIIVWDRSKW